MYNAQYEQGVIERQTALDRLQRLYTVDDRTSWIKSPVKPDAMDFYLPDHELAIDFGFKSISKDYNTFSLPFEQFTKCMGYIKNDPTIRRGMLWYKDSITEDEFKLDLSDLQDLIYKQKVKIHYGANRSRGASGCFFGIHVDFFKPFTIDDLS